MLPTFRWVTWQQNAPTKQDIDMNFSSLINFFSNFKDNAIIKQIKKQLIRFIFKDRHTPFKKTKKISNTSF